MSMVTFGRGRMASLVPNNDEFHIRNIIPDMAHKPVFLCLCHYRFPPTALELKTPIMCDFDGLVIEEANIPKAVCFLSILWVVSKTLISLKSCYILSGLVLKQVNLLLRHGGISSSVIRQRNSVSCDSITENLCWTIHLIESFPGNVWESQG